MASWLGIQRYLEALIYPFPFGPASCLIYTSLFPSKRSGRALHCVVVMTEALGRRVNYDAVTKIHVHINRCYKDNRSACEGCIRLHVNEGRCRLV